MTYKNYAIQGSPYYRTETSIQSSYNAVTRAIAAFDALKKDHMNVTSCDRKVEYDRLYAAAVDLSIETAKLRERIVNAASFEGIPLEGARWTPIPSVTIST